MYKIILQINKKETITLDKSFGSFNGAAAMIDSMEKVVAYDKKENPIKRLFHNDIQIVGYEIRRKMKTKITKVFNEATQEEVEVVSYICDGCGKSFGKIGIPPLCGICRSK